MDNGNYDWTRFEEEFIRGSANLNDISLRRPSSKIDYQAALAQVSESMIRFRKPDHLVKMIVRVIDRQVGTRHTAALLYKAEKRSFVLIDSKGDEDKRIPVGKTTTLFMDNPLIDVFMSSELSGMMGDSGVLIYEQLEVRLNDQSFLDKNPQLIEKLKRIKFEMDLLEVRICIPSYFKGRLLGILALGDKLSGEKFSGEEINFFLTLANDAAMAISNGRLIERLQEKVKEVGALYEKANSLFIRVSIAMATAIDARDPYTHGHTVRVTSYSLAMAEELKELDVIRPFDNFKENLQIAALLHDIGKIGIPDNILHKKEQLTPEEFEKIREHPTIGATILYPIKELSGILSAVRSHQERFDGNGYPDRLKGEEIPLLARIIAVADTFDAMTSNRPYRDKKPHEDAVTEIKRCSGTQFDPHITEAFLRAYEKDKLLKLV